MPLINIPVNCVMGAVSPMICFISFHPAISFFFVWACLLPRSLALFSRHLSSTLSRPFALSSRSPLPPRSRPVFPGSGPVARSARLGSGVGRHNSSPGPFSDRPSSDIGSVGGRVRRYGGLGEPFSTLYDPNEQPNDYATALDHAGSVRRSSQMQ